MPALAAAQPKRSRRPAEAVPVRLDDSEKRRYPRRPVLWGGRIQAAEKCLDGQVFNISAGGVMIRLPETLPENTPVTLLLRNQWQLDGFVRWASDGRHGVAFVESPQAVRKSFGEHARALGLNRGKR